MKICNDSFNAETPELASIFARWPFTLSDFQKFAIDGILNGKHVIITAHTGNGKTLPADFAISHFTKLGKKVIYTSPIKALTNQKYNTFSEKYPEIEFGIITGDTTMNPGAQCLFVTTEILRNTLFKKKWLDANEDKDMGCVQCQRANTVQTYVQWGRTSCSNGHQLEYSGLVMSAWSMGTSKKSEYLCVDPARTPHAQSSDANDHGALLFTTEMRSGSADESVTPEYYEVACAVCSVPNGEGSVYTRWGSLECASDATELYQGFMASSHYNDDGGGAPTDEGGAKHPPVGRFTRSISV